MKDASGCADGEFYSERRVFKIWFQGFRGLGLTRSLFMLSEDFTHGT